MTLGQKLIDIRKKNNVSRKELSDALSISYTTLSNYETDYSTPDYMTLKKMCWFFSITSDYLLDLPEYAEPEKRELRYFLNAKDITFNGIKINDEEREAAKIALALVFRTQKRVTDVRSPRKCKFNYPDFTVEKTKIMNQLNMTQHCAVIDGNLSYLYVLAEDAPISINMILDYEKLNDWLINNTEDGFKPRKYNFFFYQNNIFTRFKDNLTFETISDPELTNNLLELMRFQKKQ